MILILLLFFNSSQTLTLLDGLVTLNFQFIDQYIQFELQCKTQYWCAIGFGTSIYNIDLIRLTNSNNQLLIQDLQEKAQAQFNIPLIDEQQDIYIINSNITDQYLYAIFQKPLQSDDLTDAIIDYYTNIDMIIFLNNENANFNKYSQIQKFQLQTYQCHYSCLTCFGPSSTQCSRCQNNNIQVINGQCNQSYYNNITNFYNEQVIIKDEFILQWEYTTDDILLQIVIFKCDWFGLGFNSDKMQNTDMVQLYFYELSVNDEKTYYAEIDDMIGKQNMPPIPDTQQYGNQDWNIDSFDYDSTLFTIRIRRKLKTLDDDDYDFTNKQNIICIYAYGYGDQAYHNANRGAFTFELSKNKLSYSVDEWDKLVYNGHLILLFFIWSLISDVGIFYGRQLKSYPKYIKIHGMIFLFLTIITYFFVFSMISQQKDKIQQLGYQSTTIIIHFLIGVLILLTLLFQVFLGMLARNNLESPNGTYLIYKVKYIHKYLGYFLYILTKFQVYVGLSLVNQMYVGLFIIYCILLFLIKFTIEMLYCYEVSAISRQRIKYSQIEQDQQSLYESILEKLNNGIKYQEMIEEYPKILYIILREAVYDISDFNHPGGQYIFRKIQGKEIGRYFYGAFPLQDTQLHKHSQFAINYIETRYIGDFRNESCPLFYSIEFNNKKNSFIWTLREVKSMGNGISLFRFTDSDFRVAESFNGISWFGRYCYIKPFGIGVDFQERPYSVVQCLSKDNIKYRFELIEYFKQQNWNKQLPQQPQLSNSIQFVIKKYNSEKNFSRFIHNNNHKRFEITGPYGFGLELDENTRGVHYVFCQGTGVLPFLDLCDYLLRKSLFIIMNKQGLNQKSQYNLLDQFKLILCVSSKTQICGYPILQDLEHLSQQYNLNNFQLHIIKRHFDKKYLQEILQFKVGRIYVCGYQTYEDEIIELLMQCGVDNKLISQI